MSDADVRAYVIADNKLAENAGWDRELLGLELQYLQDLDIELDLTVTGFELAEIDTLIGEVAIDEPDQDPADEPVVPAEGDPVTQAGDIWLIGDHRLICGDATITDTYAALLGEERAQMVWTCNGMVPVACLSLCHLSFESQGAYAAQI